MLAVAIALCLSAAEVPQPAPSAEPASVNDRDALRGDWRPGEVTPVSAGVGYQLELGLDVGYEWQLGIVTLALVLGVGAGVAIDSLIGTTLPVFAFGPSYYENQVPRRTGFSGSLNLNVLRLGFAF